MERSGSRQRPAEGLSLTLNRRTVRTGDNTGTVITPFFFHPPRSIPIPFILATLFTHGFSPSVRPPAAPRAPRGASPPDSSRFPPPPISEVQNPHQAPRGFSRSFEPKRLRPTGCRAGKPGNYALQHRVERGGVIPCQDPPRRISPFRVSVFPTYLARYGAALNRAG